MSVRWKDKADIGTLAADDRMPVTDTSASNVDKYTTPAEIATYAASALAGTFQPLDSDLTAIAALATTAYGRSLLTLANATALAAEVDSFFLTPAEGNAAYQPLDSDLTAIAALATTSFGRSLLALADDDALAAEISEFYQPLDATLTALAAYNTNGLLTQTAADTFAGRTITGTANQITVGNGDGVAGNPTLSLPSDVIIPTAITVPNTGLHLLDTNATHDLIVAPGSNLTADRTLTVTTGDTDIILNLTDPGADRLMFWDESAGQWRDVTLGTNLSITDTTINATGGGLVLLSSGTVTNQAALDFVLTSLTSYKGFKLFAHLLPANDGDALWSRFSTDGGSTYDATGYSYVENFALDTPAAGQTTSGSANQIVLMGTIGNGSQEGLNLEVTLFNPFSAALNSRLLFHGTSRTNAATPATAVSITGGAREAAQDTDAWRLLFSSGNIASGTYSFYGIP